MLIDIRDKNDRLRFSMGIGSECHIVGLTSGCYDLFHNMHLVYLQRCKRLCDFLIVGVDSDDFVRAKKGPERPIIGEHHRVSLVAALKCVDVAFVMGSLEDFEIAVQELGVSRIFKNESFKKEEIVGNKEAEVIIVPDINPMNSTSQIIEEIKKARTKT